MLPAQVSYWDLQEKGRHNLQTEYQQQMELAETKRHNAEMERYNFGNLAEIIRHNQTTEGFTSTQIAEMGRHNVASEQLSHEANQASFAHAAAAGLSAQAASENAATNRRAQLFKESSWGSEFNQGVYEFDQKNAQAWQSIGNQSTQAQAAQSQAESSSRQAGVAEEKVGSEKFRNYTSGFDNIMSGVRSGVGAVTDIYSGGLTSAAEALSESDKSWLNFGRAISD